MSDIQKIYDDMWVNAIQRIKDNRSEIDNSMNSSEDTRRGDSVTLSDIDVNAYSDAFEQAVKDIVPLKIRYSGVTASPSCILVQGFPDNDQLNILRDKLRSSFKKANLYQTTIDLRYEISASHTTVERFRKPLRNRDEFIEVLSKYRKSDFGTLAVDRLELVLNNCHQDLLLTNSYIAVNLAEKSKK